MGDEEFPRKKPQTSDWVIRHVESGESIPGMVFTIYVAESDASEDVRYFDLQCALGEPTAQDVDLELDSYCIVNDAGGVQFGGLDEVTMGPDGLVLRFRTMLRRSWNSPPCGHPGNRLGHRCR
ncbi:hypothetical protein SMICM304S_11833 [Streptomyces microflavus]